MALNNALSVLQQLEQEMRQLARDDARDDALEGTRAWTAPLDAHARDMQTQFAREQARARMVFDEATLRRHGALDAIGIAGDSRRASSGSGASMSMLAPGMAISTGSAP